MMILIFSFTIRRDIEQIITCEQEKSFIKEAPKSHLLPGIHRFPFMMISRTSLGLSLGRRLMYSARTPKGSSQLQSSKNSRLLQQFCDFGPESSLLFFTQKCTGFVEADDAVLIYKYCKRNSSFGKRAGELSVFIPGCLGF